MPKILAKFIATFLYVGYFPLIPGTAGSLAGVFVYFLIKNNTAVHILGFFALLILGLLSCGRVEEISGKKDPSFVVIDEVCGMLLALSFLPYSLKLVFLAFVIFRILDTLKPWPVGSVERFKGSLGIMGDDIIAGAYTNIILQVVARFITFRGS